MANAEQIEELEALKAIFGDRLQEISTCPVIIKIVNIVGSPPIISLDLEVEFSTDYPKNAPSFRIYSTSYKFQDTQALEALLTIECNKNRGYPAVFSLVTTIEDWLSQSRNTPSSTIAVLQVPSPSKTIIEDEFEDKPLDHSAFLRWQAEFQKLQVQNKVVKKATGKDWFQNNKFSEHMELQAEQLGGDVGGLSIDDEDLFKELNLSDEE